MAGNDPQKYRRNAFFRKLEKSINPDELEQLKSLHREILPKRKRQKTNNFFFEALTDEGYITPHNVMHLQMCMDEIDRPDLRDMITNFCRENGGCIYYTIGADERTYIHENNTSLTEEERKPLLSRTRQWLGRNRRVVLETEHGEVLDFPTDDELPTESGNDCQPLTCFMKCPYRSKVNGATEQVGILKEKLLLAEHKSEELAENLLIQENKAETLEETLLLAEDKAVELAGKLTYAETIAGKLLSQFDEVISNCVCYDLDVFDTESFPGTLNLYNMRRVEKGDNFLRSRLSRVYDLDNRVHKCDDNQLQMYRNQIIHDFLRKKLDRVI